MSAWMEIGCINSDLEMMRKKEQKKPNNPGIQASIVLSDADNFLAVP